MRITSIAALLAFVAMGCTGGSRFDPYEEPGWVVRGSGAVRAEGGRFFHGVGLVTGVANRSLARTTAESRARAEVGRLFGAYLSSLMRDALAQRSEGGAAGAQKEQRIEQTVPGFSAVGMSGAAIAEHWWDPVDGTVFVLARLDLKGLDRLLERLDDLDDQSRDHIRANAERVFDDLTHEGGCHR